MTQSASNLKEYLIKNDGEKLLNPHYECSEYYNKHSQNLSVEQRNSLIRLMKMQFHDPIQYILSIKVLLD